MIRRVTARRPGKRIAIIQSSYIPWKGYFDIVNQVDEFVLYDDVQYTRRDWRNRNLIKTPHGTHWLSIPVNSRGRRLELIKDVTISDPDWNVRHWKSVVAHYSRAAHFADYAPLLEDLYLSTREERLSAVNHRFLTALCGILDIRTPITWSMDYKLRNDEARKTERLVELCKDAGATAYLSGPTARDYIDAALFEGAGIELSFMDYSGYPEYRQLHPPFVHGVSILDLILNEGPDAPRYMLSFGR